MLLYLGNIILSVSTGSGALVGPKSLADDYANSYARHDAIRGKPVLQVIGEELDTREFGFFFDETFCDPETQWTLLMAAYKNKTALPLITAGAFDGRHFVVDRLSRDIRKTSRAGRVVRLESTLSLLEAPISDPLSSALSGAVRDAAGLGSSSTKPQALK